VVDMAKVTKGERRGRLDDDANIASEKAPVVRVRSEVIS
jgi:hypothetical protein